MALESDYLLLTASFQGARQLRAGARDAEQREHLDDSVLGGRGRERGRRLLPGLRAGQRLHAGDVQVRAEHVERRVDVEAVQGQPSAPAVPLRAGRAAAAAPSALPQLCLRRSPRKGPTRPRRLRGRTSSPSGGGRKSQSRG